MGSISTSVEHLLTMQAREAFLFVSKIKIETTRVKEIIANLSRCFGFITAWFTALDNEVKGEMLQMRLMELNFKIVYTQLTKEINGWLSLNYLFG